MAKAKSTDDATPDNGEEFDPTAPPVIPPPVSGTEGPLWAETADGTTIPQYALSDIQRIPLYVDDAKFFPSQFVEAGQEPREYAVILFRFADTSKVATTRTGSPQVVELLQGASLPVSGMFVTKVSRAGREYAALVPPESEDSHGKSRS